MLSMILALLLLLAGNAFANDLQEGVTQDLGPETEMAPTPVATPIVEQARGWGDKFFGTVYPNTDRNYIFSFGFGIGDSNSHFTSTNESPKGGSVFIGQLAWTYRFPRWFISTRGSYIFGTQSQKTRENLDLKTADNKTIRLVKWESEYAMDETNVDQLVGLRFQVSNRARIEPYLGIGFGKGTYSVKQKLKTDREHWQLFSEHNRYVLTTNHTYYVRRLIMGTNLELYRFFLFGEYQWRVIREKGVNQKQTDNNSEMNLFTAETFGDVMVKKTEYMIMFGLGFRF
ncbi:MAG: hypothetical protein ACOYL6_18890 [Bacteriovoracaceae bacterium]